MSRALQPSSLPPTRSCAASRATRSGTYLRKIRSARTNCFDNSRAAFARRAAGSPGERDMQIRFWGVRGSVPWATPVAIGHGCNTPCLQLSDEATGSTVILDAGSGIVGLGPAIKTAPGDLPVVLTHYHWDHLQGLPFLNQLYAPGWRPKIFAPILGTQNTKWITTIFESPFFPVPYERLPNQPAVEMIRAGELEIGGFDMSAIPLN